MGKKEDRIDETGRVNGSQSRGLGRAAGYRDPLKAARQSQKESGAGRQRNNVRLGRVVAEASQIDGNDESGHVGRSGGDWSDEPAAISWTKRRSHRLCSNH